MSVIIFVLAVLMFCALSPDVGAFVFLETSSISKLTIYTWAAAATAIVCRFLLPPDQLWLADIPFASFLMLYWIIAIQKAMDQK